MVNDIESRVGLRVRKARADAGLSQQALAERVNAMGGKYAKWRQSTIGKTEAGLRPLRLNEVVKLAAALRVPVATLLLGDPESGTVDVLEQQVAALHWQLARCRSLAKDLAALAEELGSESVRTSMQPPREGCPQT